ncbi:hypothetical protein [uncultured Lacinutrix sp.]|uniref:hypothetical protein n=1 Tax=uncultured Lacinutrix sp. TaxID=574032 RepID=UPI0026224FD7|nr:hypothetical protein [uncultured Lacinutrix sp.]
MKPIKNNQKLFLIQTGLAILCFVVLAFVTKKTFYSSPKVNSYLSINEGVKEMAESTSALLDSLIEKNDVTFDPTSGKELEKVFSNLKQTKKEKFLMIGSSQLRVVKGENDLISYDKTVPNLVENLLKNKIQAYNLSLGGMSISEKLIVSNKASDLLNPENVLIAVTPWDCIADKIRPGVTAIESKVFSKQEIEPTKITKRKKGETLVFPLNINESISNNLEEFVSNNITIYAKRTGIKEWMFDEVVLASISEKEMQEKENAGIEPKADYWLTFKQDLDNITAWDKNEFKTGSRSLKIVNSKKNSAKWEGDIIYLNKHTNTFIFEGWSKTDSVSSDTKLLAIDHEITFTDNSTQWYYKKLRFNKGTHDWQKVSTKIVFDKPVKSIKPHLLFYGGTGTVWFDDISIYPIIDEKKENNIVPNPSAEAFSRERLNVSYSYNASRWEIIENNIISVIDHLALSKSKNKYLLLTPFWYTPKKSAYPQKEQYASLVKKIKAYCKSKKVKCIDASFILNKDNFGIYTNGKNKDKIDVLHFNAQAHEKLAKYVIKNLN